MKIKSSVAASSYLLDAVTNNIDQGISVRTFSLHSVRSIIMKLMLVMMIVGGWNVVWGQCPSITFSTQGYSNGETITSATISTSISVTFNKGSNSNAPKYYTTGSAVRVYGGNYFTITSTSNNISSINITFSSGGDNNDITTSTGTYNNGSWTGSAASVKFTVSGSSGHRRIASIEVCVAPSYTITAQSNNDSYGTVSLSGTTITATPADCYRIASPAYTVAPVNAATVSQSGNTFNVTPSSNCTVTINFAPKPAYNVNWIVGGSTIRTRSYCQGSTIPAGDVPDDPTSGDCNGKTFIGWSATEVAETDDEPTLVTAAGATVNGEMNFYAVFAEASGSGHNEYCLYSGALTEGDYVIYYSGKAMDTTVSSDRLQYEEVTPISNTITTTDASIVWHIAPSGNYWTIYNAAAGKYAASTGVKNKAQMLDDGTDDKSLWSNSGTSTYEFVNKKNSASAINSNLRNNGTFGFACYASGTGGALSLYKRTISYSAYSTSCTPCEADATISSTALTASDITISSATINCPGGITNFGGAHCLISSYGFVYGTSANPTLENGTEVVAGTTYTTTNTSFNKIIEGLDPCATYHVRAYATNGHGTAYGPDFTFTTANNATITSLPPDCLKNTEATINITYSSCTAASDIFVIAIRKGANGPVSLGTTSPVSITANTVMGSGYQFGEGPNNSYVVYKSNGSTMPTSLTITGLEAGATYKLKAYRWQSAESRWTTDGASRTLTMPSVTNLQADNNETSEVLTWNISETVCAGGHYVVICKEGDSDITSTCANFTSITANAAFGSGTQTQTGEYAVYSGSATTASITNITSGTTYTVAVFYVDANGNCSLPAQTTFTYSETTILEPGDLAIVAVNNKRLDIFKNTADEFSFVIFKGITPETSIDMTDNGYGRVYEDLWGTDEGFWRITRKNSSLDAGSVITITETTGGIGYTGEGGGGVEPDLWNNINIYVNGVRDYGNWEISVNGPLDLNQKDQIWIMQGGEWLRDTEGGKTVHNAYYTGNVLYGYTATGWLDNYGYDNVTIPNTDNDDDGDDDEHYGSKGSNIYPGCGCFVTTIEVGDGIVKYTGPLDHATKREWIMRINDESNWTDYTTSTYPDAERNYCNTSKPDATNYPSVNYPLTIDPGDFTKGKWNGRESDDWCDCRNWVSLVVPDENYDVEIPDVGNRNRVSLHEGVTAKCKTLTVKSGGFFNNTQANSVLKVVDDITIDVGGSFRPSENKAFEIIIGGNILNNGVFITNESTSLTLNGESSQSISAPSSGGNFKLRNLTIASPSNVFDADTIELYGNLRDNSASNLGFYLPQALSLKGSISQTSTKTTITDITINKSSNNLNLSGMLTVNGIAKFVKGNIVGNVTFTETATSENASTRSYVDGTVTKKANASAFTFPTGSNGVLGALNVTTLSADTDLKFNHEPDGFSASQMPVWWNQNNMCPANGSNDKFDHVTNMYFWNLGSSSPMEDAVFTVTADDDIHFNVATVEHEEPDIAMAIYDGCWKNLGGAASTNASSYTYISISDVDLPATRAGGDKIVTFGSIEHNTLLPIELVSFAAECKDGDTEISWTTASEYSNDYFVLERSYDAVNFAEVARIAGAGNSISQTNYSHTVYGGGSAYYRLVQVDYDGTSTVSEMIVAECSNAADGDIDVKAYPNPFAGDLTLRFENFGGRMALVEVYDMLGRMLVSRKVLCSQNDYELVMPLEGLPDGAYNVRVSAEDVVINRQVVKE